MAYHARDIKKGVYGHPSKIIEETEEFADAVEQGITVMALLELADLYGAMEAYLYYYHPTLTMDDLKAMSNVTKSAFIDGSRF